jgi:hypothetical protein
MDSKVKPLAVMQLLYNRPSIFYRSTLDSIRWTTVVYQGTMLNLIGSRPRLYNLLLNDFRLGHAMTHPPIFGWGESLRKRV